MKSISHTTSFKIEQPAARVFPLFSPEGEKKWVPGWDYTNVMGTTELSEDYIFLTNTHDHRSSEAIWIVKNYDPASYFVQYYKIEPADKIGVVTVKCSEQEAGKTEVQVTYTYTALSTSGEKFVIGFSKVVFEKFIAEWNRLLKEYFESER